MDTFKLFVYFFKAYPKRSMLMVFCLLLSGLSEGAGMMTLLPIVEAMSSGGGGAGASTVSRLISQGIAIIGLTPSLPVLLLIMVILIVTKAVLGFFAMSQVGYTLANVSNDLRLKLIKSLMEVRWIYFTSQPAGLFSNAISNEISRIGLAYQHVIGMVAVLIQLLVYGAVALVLSWKITVMASAIGFLLMIVLGGLVRLSREAGERQTALMKSLIARLADTIQGVKAIKAMAMEKSVQRFLEADSDALTATHRRIVFAREMLLAVNEPLTVTLVAIGLYLSIVLGGQSFSTLLVLAVLFYRLLQRYTFIMGCLQEINASKSALWSLKENLDHAEQHREELTNSAQLPVLNEAITYKNVSFGYGEKIILNNISFEIPKGSFVTILGPSGVGKTTIADMLLGLYTPRSGEVCVDGVPLSRIDLRAWRRMIGYVPQEMLLFHATIFQNVTFGDPSITREDVEESLKLAEAWDFVSSLSDGLDTSVGERGSRLSGGQRQRLSLARALARKPAILILDEVTASLDSKAEMDICSTLRRLSGRVTILAISHQPAMIKFAHMIYEVKGGGVSRKFF